jgi:hypothetical protein
MYTPLPARYPLWTYDMSYREGLTSSKSTESCSLTTVALAGPPGRPPSHWSFGVYSSSHEYGVTCAHTVGADVYMVCALQVARGSGRRRI